SEYEETNDAQIESFVNPVSARAGGFIKKVYFEEHQEVHQGDTLVILDDSEYFQKVKEAEAMLEDTKAQQEILAATIRSAEMATLDRKSTRLNSSHVKISYAVFCLKKKK